MLVKICSHIKYLKVRTSSLLEMFTIKLVEHLTFLELLTLKFIHIFKVYNYLQSVDKYCIVAMTTVELVSSGGVKGTVVGLC